MYSPSKILAALAVSVSLIVSAPAFAKNDHGKGHGKGHSKHEREYDHNEDNDNDVNVNVTVINERNRERIRYHAAQDYREHCPPGLAKKHNGCMPPGQYKKRYVVGRPLPSYVTYQPVPAYWMADLEPVPYGYRYVRVDNDVLLISEASHHVIDAITLLSAVGN